MRASSLAAIAILLGVLSALCDGRCGGFRRSPGERMGKAEPAAGRTESQVRLGGQRSLRSVPSGSGFTGADTTASRRAFISSFGTRRRPTWEQRFPDTSPPGVCCVDGAETFDLANRRFRAVPRRIAQSRLAVVAEGAAEELGGVALRCGDEHLDQHAAAAVPGAGEILQGGLGLAQRLRHLRRQAPGGPVLRRPGRRRRDEQPVRLRRLRQLPGALGGREPAFAARRQRFLLRLRQRLRRGVRQPVSDRREDVHLPLLDQQVGSPRSEALPHGQERRPLLDDSQDGLRLHERASACA